MYRPYIQYRNRTIIMCLAILVVFFLFFRNRTNSTVYILPEEEALSITGEQGERVEINYRDIVSTGLWEDIDFGEAVDGTDTRKGVDGLWKNEIWGEYRRITVYKAKKYIVMGTKESVIVFNYEDTAATEELYRAFYDLMLQKGLAEQIQFTPEIDG